VLQWTNLDESVIEKFRALLLNQTEVTEVAPHQFYTFIINLTQIFCCLGLLFLEEVYKGGITWAIYAQIGFSVYYMVYLRLNNNLDSIGLMFLTALFEAIFFGGHFMIYTDMISEHNQVVYAHWVRINSVIIIAKFFYLFVLVKMAKSLNEQLMTKAIFAAQRN